MLTWDLEIWESFRVLFWRVTRLEYSLKSRVSPERWHVPPGETSVRCAAVWTSSNPGCTVRRACSPSVFTARTVWTFSYQTCDGEAFSPQQASRSVWKGAYQTHVIPLSTCCKAWNAARMFGMRPVQSHIWDKDVLCVALVICVKEKKKKSVLVFHFILFILFFLKTIWITTKCSITGRFNIALYFTIYGLKVTTVERDVSVRIEILL